MQQQTRVQTRGQRSIDLLNIITAADQLASGQGRPLYRLLEEARYAPGTSPYDRILWYLSTHADLTAAGIKPAHQPERTEDGAGSVLPAEWR